MHIADLQNSARRIVRKRIDAGLILGGAIAQRAEFEHAHLSNFLHGNRNLSLASFDRLLDALGISVMDLVKEIRLRNRVPLKIRKG